MNNKTLKLLVAGLACLAFCGTTFAAPKHGHGGGAPRKAPVVQKAPAPKPGHHHAEPHHGHHGGHYVKHNAPPPPPPPPPPVVVTHEEPALLTTVGAFLGGLLGAAL